MCLFLVNLIFLFLKFLLVFYDVIYRYDGFEDFLGVIEKFYYGIYYFNVLGVMYYMIRMELFITLYI